MTTPNETTKPRVTFCATVSEESGEDPAGSSWALRRMIFFELPLPWPENSLQARNAPEGLEAFMWEMYKELPEPWGMIGIAPDPDYSVDGMTRIFDLQLRDGLASTYHRESYLVPSGETVRYLRLLSFEPDHADLAAARQPDDQVTRDFLICTHGSVDACCATMGYPMYKLMRMMADQAATPVRVWRCTHFGGHRFAATALEAPDGRYWARLKADMLAKLVHRRAAVRELRPHYRGWSALPEPLWQVAEAEIFARAGWAWTEVTVTGITGEATPEDGGVLTFRFTHPSCTSGEVDVELTPAGTLQTMDSTNDDHLRDAPQYTARVIRQHPEKCLDLPVPRGS
jgi:hypothetical protein